MLIWINSCGNNYRGYLFLDRDGVINFDRPDYIKEWGEIKFYTDAIEALRKLEHKRIGVILISNQSAINRGLISWQNFWDIHQKMVHHLASAGGNLSAAFYCPHRPDEYCSCRKPLPGMLSFASRILQIPLTKTYMIGDRRTDLEAAQKAGCKPVLISRDDMRGEHPSQLAESKSFKHYVTLFDAVSDLFQHNL